MHHHAMTTLSVVMLALREGKYFDGLNGSWHHPEGIPDSTGRDCCSIAPHEVLRSRPLPLQTASLSASSFGSPSLSVRDCRALVAPVVKGTENLPDPLGPRRPLLFIGMNLWASSTSLVTLQLVLDRSAGVIHLYTDRSYV